MLGCLHCGHENKDNALYCGMCGDVLVQRHDYDNVLAPTIGPSYRCQYVTPDDVKRHAAKARHFLLALAALAAFPLGLLSAGWAGWLAPPERGGPGITVTLLLPGAIVYSFVLYGFLIAKTGESAGAPFLSNFLMGCVPPLTPALWAHLGGCSAAKPYLYLAADVAVLWATVWLFHEWPFMLVLMVFVMIPVIVYHLLGCATGPLAGVLGLSPTLLTLWLCLVPDLLLALAVWDFLGTLDPADARQSLALTLAEIKLYLNLDYLLSYNHFKMAAFIYLLVTLTAWIKIVHDNLRLPLL